FASSAGRPSGSAQPRGLDTNTWTASAPILSAYFRPPVARPPATGTCAPTGQAGTGLLDEVMAGSAYPVRPGHGPWTTGSRTSDDRVTDLGRPGHGPRTIVTVEPRGASPPPGDWNRTILPPKPVTLTSKPDSRRARPSPRTVRPSTYGTLSLCSLPLSQPSMNGPSTDTHTHLVVTCII